MAFRLATKWFLVWADSRFNSERRRDQGRMAESGQSAGSQSDRHLGLLEASAIGLLARPVRIRPSSRLPLWAGRASPRRDAAAGPPPTLSGQAREGPRLA